MTGASGFVGEETTRHFLDDGWQVVGTVRSLEQPGRMDREGLSYVATGDISEIADWTPFLDGCDVVVHLAARAHKTKESPGAAAELFQRINVDATARLARDAAAAGVKRFVFVSSAGVMGDFSEEPFKSSDLPRPQSEYAKSKLRAEQELTSIAGKTGLEVVILRPVLIYGPGNPGNLDRLLRLIGSGVPLPLKGVANRRSLLNVGYLATAIGRAAVDQSTTGKTFLLADDTDLSTPELVALLAKGMGVGVRMFHVPRSILLLLGMLTGRSGEIKRLVGSFQIDPTARAASFGSFPRERTVEELIATGSAYKAKAA